MQRYRVLSAQLERSFFSKANKPIVQSSDDKSKKESLDDSPIKQTKRKNRVIESDSEDEATSRLQEEKENKSITPEKKKSRNSSPVQQSPRPSSSKSDVGFSTESVPPLRKTARKNMERKKNGTEEKQRKLIEKIKSDSPSPEKISASSKSPIKGKNDPEETKSDSTTKPKRTNCLDKFVFNKTPKNSEKSTNNTKKEPTANCEDKRTTGEDKKIAGEESKKENHSEDSKMDVDEEESIKKDSPKSTKRKSSPKSSKKKSKNKAATKSIKESSASPKKESPSKVKTESPSKVEKDSPSKVKKESPSKVKKESPSKAKKESPSKVNKESPVKSPAGSSSGKSSPEPSKSSKSDDKNALKKTSSSKSPAANPFSFSKRDEDAKSGKEFDPLKTKFDPLQDATWKHRENVPFAALSKTFEIIEETSGRLKTIEILSNFLRSVIVLSPQDFLFCVYLCLNKVAPAFEGIELGVGELYICKAIAEATGRSLAAIKSDISEKGDLGIVAEHSKSNQRMMFQPARLTVTKVFSNLKEIALMSGHSSQVKKIDKIKSMLVACKGSEARFLIRFLGGKLRIGLAEQSVLQAVAQACYLTPPGQEFPPDVTNRGKGLSPETLKAKFEEYALIFKTTYCECPSFDSIVPVLLEHGMEELPNHCKLQPGIPLKPMLAHPTKGVSEVLKRFEKCKFTCEYKYDGERAQIHMKEDGTINIFSRNQENNTSKYPDIISRFKESLGPEVKSCVVDSEAVAYNVQEKKILPFQILSTRKRKDANESEIKVQVCVFPFDLLYLNGRNLVTETFETRRDLLKSNFVEKEGEFLFAKSMDSNNTEDIEEFLEESIKGNCEGLMVKSLDVDATYEIAKRSRNWLKLKKDYLDGVGDTIDVAVIGGFLGKGKRTGTYGGFLIACYDPENEEFQSLCKIGTGFTEDILQKHTDFFKDHVIDSPKSYYRYDNSVAPDHWFEAVQVWEIKCADLSVSPVHKAAIGIVDPEKGISLRFPRFLRIRDDKSPEDATSASQIADLYKNQDQIKNQTDSHSQDEEFY